MVLSLQVPTDFIEYYCEYNRKYCNAVRRTFPTLYDLRDGFCFAKSFHKLVRKKLVQLSNY